MANYNVHPYQRAHEAREYMTLDMDSLNPYNYKNLPDGMASYQRYQNNYYNTRQLNPISLVHLSPQMMDPSNLPSDIRPTIYEAVNLNNQERNNQYQSNINNPNLWKGNTPAKGKYYTQNEYNPYFPRPISNINAGHATSFQEFHGLELY